MMNALSTDQLAIQQHIGLLSKVCDRRAPRIGRVDPRLGLVEPVG